MRSVVSIRSAQGSGWDSNRAPIFVLLLGLVPDPNRSSNLQKPSLLCHVVYPKVMLKSHVNHVVWVPGTRLVVVLVLNCTFE